MLNDDVKTYIEKLAKNKLYIAEFEQVDLILSDENLCDRYVVFANIALKNYFLENTSRTIINCNTSYDKFIDDMENAYSDYSAFNNIGCCTDVRILDIIDKTKNLRIE